MYWMVTDQKIEALQGDERIVGFLQDEAAADLIGHFLMDFMLVEGIPYEHRSNFADGARGVIDNWNVSDPDRLCELMVDAFAIDAQIPPDLELHIADSDVAAAKREALAAEERRSYAQEQAAAEAVVATRREEAARAAEALNREAAGSSSLSKLISRFRNEP